MDAKTLQQRLDAARSFSHTIGQITFRGRLLPESRVAGIYARHPGSGGAVDAGRELLGEAILGVKGATTADLDLPGEPEPIDDTRDTAVMVLEARLDICIELAGVIAELSTARSRAIEDDAKN